MAGAEPDVAGVGHVVIGESFRSGSPSHSVMLESARDGQSAGAGRHPYGAGRLGRPQRSDSFKTPRARPA